MGTGKLKILILEDEPVDAELIELELRRAGLDFVAIRCNNEKSFRQDLIQFEPDVILSDYSLPRYSGAEAFVAAKEILPDALFICVSGVLDEETAIEGVKQGVTDYVLKHHLSRLPNVVEKAVSARDNDIQRRRTEEALIESEKRFRSLAESAVDAIVTADTSMNVVFWNNAAERIFGYAAGEIIGKPIMCIIPQRYQNDHKTAIHNYAEQNKPGSGGRIIETIGIRKDGSEVPLEISLSTSELAEEKFVTAIMRDVTERKGAEESIQRINRALKVLSGANEVLVRATDETMLLEDVCDVIVTTGGYRMAWVGYLQADAQKTVSPVVYAGHEDGFLTAVKKSMKNPELVNCPTVKAIRTGKPAPAPEFSKAVSERWQGEVAKRGYKSCIALPLMESGETFGAITLYSGELMVFDEEEVQLLLELANDISFGIKTQQTRNLKEQAQIDLERSEARVRQSLARMRQITGGIIEAMALTVETRDPYTAGHQRRVTDLARAIGKEIGVTADELEGIRTAGAIHDVGKIHVPSEILSKPGGLTELEMGIIQTHSQVGYDILKEIDFPWPVAEIVLQHHERMDGSGYPQGLAGDKILLEARILSVADVVEAMISHRPYRPALGIDKALEEVSQQRGRLYYAPAVDACLVLFREKGFTFNVRAVNRLKPVA